PFVGPPGLTTLSQSSAGSTITAAYTTYQPTVTPSTTAGKFNATFVVAGSTLEDFYTQGLEGDVIARSGNTLTVRGSTLQLNTGASEYCTSWPSLLGSSSVDAVVLLGPGT